MTNNFLRAVLEDEHYPNHPETIDVFKQEIEVIIHATVAQAMENLMKILVFLRAHSKFRKLKH